MLITQGDKDNDPQSNQDSFNTENKGVQEEKKKNIAKHNNNDEAGESMSTDNKPGPLISS